MEPDGAERMGLRFTSSVPGRETLLTPRDPDDPHDLHTVIVPWLRRITLIGLSSFVGGHH